MRYLLACLAPLLLAVGCGEQNDAVAPPSAPTNLMITAVAGGAHLIWTDTSDNEDHFMIMRKETAAFHEVDVVAFNTTQYHDATVTAGTTYVFKIVAMNSKGEASSNEVTFTP